MPRVHKVEKARKPIPSADIKVGDTYYWWKFRFRGKQVSKTPPRQSQLTQSEFWGRVYDLQERGQPDFDSLESELDDIKSEVESLRDEQDEKKQNMPESLQESATGELLQNRYDSLDSVNSDLDSIEVPDEDTLKEEVAESYDSNKGADEKPWDELTEEKQEELITQAKDEKANEIWGEITDALGNISD